MLSGKINKKAQIGETISWIVATVIIIAILIISIYISMLMSQVKNIRIGDLKLDTDKNLDLLEEKTSFAYQLSNNKNRVVIENILKQNE